MKTILNEWNNIFQAPASDEVTLRRLDGYNKTRYSRRKNQEGLLEVASREAYDQRKVHFATVLLDDDTPYCAIESNTGYFGVDFLRENYDNYLIYIYIDEYSEGVKLFLESIRLVIKNPSNFDAVNSITFRFALDQTWSMVMYKGSVGTWESVLERSEKPFGKDEFSLLWVDYPAFKEYDQLIRLDRIPEAVRERIFEYTDTEYPAFREHLQRDLNRYQDHP